MLKSVKLNYNKLEKIPAVLTEFRKLTNLELGGCLLTEVGPTIAKLRAIKSLDLSGNKIATVHGAIAEQQTMTYLNLENNYLTQLPSEMGTMVNLEILDLSNNRLTSLPDSFGGMTKLRNLEVNSNELVSMPPTMGHLRNLKDLDCRYNNFEEPGKSKSEGPVDAFLEFLRDEEQRIKQEEIERLKPVPTMNGIYTEYRMKIESKGQNAGNGGPSDPTDDRPYLRAGHSLTWGSNHLFIFGGALLHQSRKVNDLFVTNLDRMVWSKVDPSGERPVERDGHAAVFDPKRKRLLVFGGRSITKKRLNDLFAYDMETNKWSRLDPTGDTPAPRESASMVLVNDHTAMLFGGKGGGGRFNDAQFLDLTTPNCVWSQPIVSGSAPGPRQDSGLCAAEGKVYVHAGRDNFVRDDLYELDISDPKNMVWSAIPTSGRAPPACYGHEMTFLNGMVYTYGGFDELGGNLKRSFRLEFEPTAGGDDSTPGGSKRLAGTGGRASVPKEALKPEWSEMDPELSFNENRCAVISPSHSLHCLQVGSMALGLTTNVAPEHSFWDAFKCGDMADFKVKKLKMEDLAPVNGKKMRVEHTTISKAKDLVEIKALRTRLTGNDIFEIKMLKYVDKWRKQFIEMYPHRVPLLLDPPNECGVRKFVCTTVRPTKLFYSELYNLESCAGFVATYHEYEHLENPILFPETIPSPYAVMAWQGGDCFDLAITLCSLLCGVGYDAYVCVGYAPRAVTECDQSKLVCPVLEREAAEKAAAEAAAQKGEVKPVVESKYKIKEALVLISQYEKKVNEKKAAEEAAAAKAKAKAEEKRRVQEAFEAMDRDHDGTITIKEVRAALREMGISPSDEEIQQMIDEEDDDHDGVVLLSEVNRIKDDDDGDSVTSANLSTFEETVVVDRFDGKRKHAWVVLRAGKREVPEDIFVEPSTARQYPIDASPYQGLECVFNAVNYWVNMQHGTIEGVPGETIRDLDLDLDDEDLWESVLDVIEPTPDPEPELTEDGEDVPAPDATAPEGDVKAEADPTADGEGEAPPELEAEAEKEEIADEPQPIVEMPPSWVPKLAIAQDRFDMMCPRGYKITRYHRCTHEVFARFGECSRWDGQIQRLCTFSDDACTEKEEEREEFFRRKDKLRERIVYHNNVGTKIEKFERGAAFGIKELKIVPDVERRLDGYVSERLDGLVTRVETFVKVDGETYPVKMIETFSGRDDRMNYRSVTYDPNETAVATKAAEEAAEAAAEASGKRRRKKKVEAPPPVIKKMSEKYDLPPPGGDVPPHKCVKKRMFIVKKEMIRVDYHYGIGRITASRKMFDKDHLNHEFVLVDPMEPPPGEIEQHEELQTLLVAEKKCMDSIRDVEKEMKDMLANRTKEEQAIELASPYYDIVRISQEESDDDDDEGEEKIVLDYLTPYLPAVIAGHALTKEEALDVRDKCLKALKDRLIERANNIQRRHDNESAVLAKRKAIFERDRDQLTREDEEAHDRACDESAFTLRILNQRLKRHEEQALERYHELDAKLRADDRLAAAGLTPTSASA